MCDSQRSRKNFGLSDPLIFRGRLIREKARNGNLSAKEEERYRELIDAFDLNDGGAVGS